MSDLQFTAVGGILLLYKPGTLATQVDAATTSLLFAWLAARKQAPADVTSVLVLTSLGKLGWVTSDGSEGDQRVAWDAFSTNLWRAALAEESWGEAFLVGARETSPQRQAAMDAWWLELQSQGRRGAPPMIVAYLAAAQQSATLRVIAPVADVGSRVAVYVSTPAELEVSVSAETLALNEAVYSQIAAELRSKVAPYGGLVVAG